MMLAPSKSSADEGVARWRPFPDKLPLAEGEVQVVRVSLDLPESTLSQLARTLSPGERERAGRFFATEDERRFIARRGLLREFLGRHLKVAPGKILFWRGPCGKPEVTSPPGRKLHFSAAHSKNIAVLALAAESPLGVDMELMRPLPDLPALVSTVFSAGERVAWETVPASERWRTFFDVWARKEAYLKGTGEGLQKAPNLIEVPLGATHPGEVLPVCDCGVEVPAWALRSLSTPHCAIAVALRHSPTRISCWDWKPT